MYTPLKRTSRDYRSDQPSRSFWRYLTKLALVAPLITAVIASADTAYQPLERAMTDEERVRSGVDSLTSKQRQYLNDWLKTRYGEAAGVDSQERVITRTNSPPKPIKQTAIDEEIERRVAEELASRKKQDSEANTNRGPFDAMLIGDFTGWRGKTVFRLDNGQVWRQRSSSQYRHRDDDYRVKFDKNWMGGWEMTVISSGKSVLVSKVK
jgi:hypothetical protein